MKKTLNKKSITFLAILLSVLISFGCTKKKETVVERKGTINSMAGDVIIKKDDKSQPAKVGDFVVSGTTIETGAKSFVAIYFGENIIRLSENTALSIDKLETAANSEQTELNLEMGEVFSKVVKKLVKGDSYQIKTPTTVAAIRGTEFGVLERDGKSKISCLSGKVKVANITLQKDKEDLEFVEVSSNEEVQVISNQPLEVTALSEEDRKRMENIFSNIGAANVDIEEKIEDTKPQIRKAPAKPKPVNTQKSIDQKDEL